MHILLLTREYLHPNLPNCGGTGVFMANFAKELVKKGHKVTVFGVAAKEIDFIDENVSVFFIKSLFKRNKFYNLLRSISGKIKLLEKLNFAIHKLEKKEISKQLATYIKQNKLPIDIIETHDFEGLSLCLETSVPIVIRCHGSWTILEKYFEYKKVQKGRIYCEKEAFKKAKNIITVSNFSKEINEATFEIENTQLIYNGIDTEFYKKNTEIAIIKNSLFFIGNVTIEKGADIAFNTFIKLSEDFPNVSLHFIGRENKALKSEFIEKAKELKLTNSLHFYGFLNKNEVLNHLNAASIVLFPSKGETFGLALCEVMSLEKPVISSNIASYLEIIEDKQNGLIATKEEDFISYSQLLFTDEDFANKLGVNARKTVISKFSNAQMVTNSLEYYTTIITENKN